MNGFRIFLACLVLGVAAIAGIGSLGAAVTAALKADARILLGGDANLRLAYRPASAEERRFLADNGTVSEVATMRAMARSLDGDRRSLIELKAVDRAYPLYGAIGLAPAQPLAAALDQRDGVFGAAVDAAVASRLGLAIGSRFKVGAATFELRASIEREPDPAIGGLAFGPRVMVADAALPETGLIQPGALVNYEYRMRLPDGADTADWARTARAAFPEAGWQVRTAADGSPALQRFLDRIAFFLDLVGVTALLVGGIGIGNAVAGFVASKTKTIATLKCLGAPSRLVFTVYLAQVLALAVAGIAVALAIGAVMPLLLRPLLAGLMPVPLRLGVYPLPLASAAVCGVLVTLAFALGPLAAIGRVMPGALFRSAIVPTNEWPPVSALMATGIAAVALGGIVVLTAPDRVVAFWYIGGALAAFALFRGAGALIALAARYVGRERRIAAHPLLRLALANLHRPAAPTSRVVLSLGLGLTVLVTIALVEGNLATEIDTRLADRAPSYFFIDIQPDQLSAFGNQVRAIPDARFDEVPMLRGRITRLNGIPVEEAHVAPEAQWALRSDRGLTYAATPPPGAHIVAGSWWPADYHGPPLISFDAGLAQGMGLHVGDSLTVNLLGREIEARIANLRQIEWTRLGINFAIVFAPGAIDGAPQTHLAAVYLPPQQEEKLVRAVTEAFPNVTAIPVREALAAVTRIVSTIGMALRLVALIALAAGVLVLGGAIAAGHRRRVYDAVVLKVLGATRGAIAAAFVAEFGLLGAATAVIAGIIGTIAAYALVTWALQMDFVFLLAPVAAVLAIAVVLTAILGFAGTWRALGAKAAPLLRND